MDHSIKLMKARDAQALRVFLWCLCFDAMLNV